METIFKIVMLGILLFFIYLIVMLGFSIGVTNNTPSMKGEAKYYEVSELDYPVYDPSFMVIVNKTILYFDDYNIAEDGVVTVSGYWRLKGTTWRRCDGSLSFREDNFVPVKIVSKRTTVEVISETCR